MIGDSTARLHLPLLHAGQAQKEIDHNEALALIDIALHPLVTAIGLNTPPVDPPEGACWIVGTEPIGAWSGQSGVLAGWTAGGWRFVVPHEGMVVTVAGTPLSARFDGQNWTVGDVHAGAVFVDGNRVIGPRRPAIAEPAGGVTVDAEARAALASVLAALRAHGLIAP